jgi:hypothetical protein
VADKNFKVKSGLNIPITSAAILTTDVNGNISSTATLPIANGGTGQTSATNAINALLPVQNESTINYTIQSDGTNVSWAKLYNQLIQNGGVSVTPRRIINFVGATLSDDSGSDTTTITFTDAVGVSKSGGDTITASSASVIPVIAKGAASQTADLQQWQNSAGTVLASIAPSGYLTVPGIISGANGIQSSASVGINIANFTSSAQLAVSTAGASYLGIIVRGAASQTADLQQWQNSSGTVLSYVTSTGSLRAPFLSDTAGTGAFIQMNSGGAALVNTRTASIVGFIVRGQTSQTADLQQWQNVGGTVLASINSAGVIKSDNIVSTNTMGSLRYYWGDVNTGNQSLSYVTGSTNAGLVIETINIGSANSTFDSCIPLTVRGLPNQTGDLQRWVNSSSTVLAKIDASGNLTVQNLTVNGTTTTINSTTLTVDDKNIELASVASPTDTTADGAGITIKGATDKTFNWVQSTASFTSSEPISAPAFKSAGTAVSSNITLVSGYKYFVDTTSARTLTLPASPSLGDEIQIFDATGTAFTNNITLSRNGNKINGISDDGIIDINGASATLTYTGSTYGWRFE